MAAHVAGGGRAGSHALASQGYFVFMPNPRGSFGQGEKYVQAIAKILATATCATSLPASMQWKSASRWTPSGWV